MANTSVSDLEQSALSVLTARHGAVPDQELVRDVIEEALASLTPIDVLMLAQEDPASFLLRQPETRGAAESPSEIMQQNLREYLAVVLNMKLAQLVAERGGV
jgi:hypothetical protein